MYVEGSELEFVVWQSALEIIQEELDVKKSQGVIDSFWSLVSFRGRENSEVAGKQVQPHTLQIGDVLGFFLLSFGPQTKNQAKKVYFPRHPGERMASGHTKKLNLKLSRRSMVGTSFR